MFRFGTQFAKIRKKKLNFYIEKNGHIHIDNLTKKKKKRSTEHGNGLPRSKLYMSGLYVEQYYI